MHRFVGLGVLFAVVALMALVPALAQTDTKSEDGQSKIKNQKSKINLVPNGDFEEGDLTPKGWQAIDGLTTFWVKDEDPARGKVIKFDTDVLQSQGYDWWVQIAKGAKWKDAPKKLPTVE